MIESEITLIRYRMDRSKEALSTARLMYGKGHYKKGAKEFYVRYDLITDFTHEHGKKLS